jgi:hypothetical protein
MLGTMGRNPAGPLRPGGARLGGRGGAFPPGAVGGPSGGRGGRPRESTPFILLLKIMLKRNLLHKHHHFWEIFSLIHRFGPTPLSIPTLFIKFFMIAHRIALIYFMGREGALDVIEVRLICTNSQLHACKFLFVLKFSSFYSIPLKHFPPITGTNFPVWLIDIVTVKLFLLFKHNINLVPISGFNQIRVFDETSFDSKQPKLEPKLVSILSKTRRLFRFNIKTACFGVSVEPKQ